MLWDYGLHLISIHLLTCSEMNVTLAWDLKLENCLMSHGATYLCCWCTARKDLSLVEKGPTSTFQSLKVSQREVLGVSWRRKESKEAQQNRPCYSPCNCETQWFWHASLVHDRSTRTTLANRTFCYNSRSNPTYGFGLRLTFGYEKAMLREI